MRVGRSVGLGASFVWGVREVKLGEERQENARAVFHAGFTDVPRPEAPVEEEDYGKGMFCLGDPELCTC